MSDISTWSATAASNNSASPDGFPEGMAPSGVNNSAREVMAPVRDQHEDAQWIDLGNTPTNTSATTFTLVGDQTTQYHVGRRVKCTDATVLYGTITVSVFSAVTTVTVVLDSGVLSGSLTAAALGIIGADNTSLGNVTVDDITAADITAADITAAKFISTAGNDIDSGLFAIKPSETQKTSDDTEAADPHLTLTLAASTTYFVEIFIKVRGEDASNGNISEFPEEPDGAWTGIRLSGAGQVTAVAGPSAGYVSQVLGATSVAILYQLTVTTSGAGGTFSWDWAQATSHPDYTAVEVGSWMKATKIG